MRILYVTTIGATMGFFPEHIKMLQKEGHTVELAANFSRPLDDGAAQLGCVRHHIPFSRSVCDRGNICAFFAVKRLIQHGRYDIVHTHTPNASAIVRLACRKHRKKGLKVFYTAHGFHFYDGAPMKNWLLYYPIEKLLSRWTDVLITINREDYKRAKKSFHAGRTAYVPGVGINIGEFGGPANPAEKRKELGVDSEAVMLLSVGELSVRKNHKVVIKALAKMRNPLLHYFIAGQGGLQKELEDLAYKLGIGAQVHMLGFRNDISELCHAADLFVFPSLQEGCPVALMEAVACGTPIICSRIRGNIDLVTEGKGGLLFAPKNEDDLKNKMEGLMKMSEKELRGFREYNFEKIQKFSSEAVNQKMRNIYKIF